MIYHRWTFHSKPCSYDPGNLQFTKLYLSLHGLGAPGTRNRKVMVSGPTALKSLMLRFVSGTAGFHQTINGSEAREIWRFPEIGVPLVIIHFNMFLMGFSIINHQFGNTAAIYEHFNIAFRWGLCFSFMVLNCFLLVSICLKWC